MPQRIKMKEDCLSRTIFMKKSGAGFTLIELMVVFLIMVILAILALMSYSEARPRLALERAAETFISDIYRVKDRSFFSVFYEDNGSYSGGDHGIAVEKGKGDYLMFTEEGEEENVIEKMKVEEIIEISKVEVFGEEENKASILFSSKNKKVYFNGVETSVGDFVDVTFSSKTDDSIKRTVRINYLGIASLKYD